MQSFSRIKHKIEALSADITVTESRGCIVLEGEVSDWQIAVKAGERAVDKKHSLGVINNIKLKDFVQERYTPPITDQSLEGASPDVLIIGGGITGCATARALSKYNLKVMLVEAKADVAQGATGANGGVIHVGVNFSSHSLKHHYNSRGNQMYAELARDLNVPFEQKGQVMLSTGRWEKLLIAFLKRKAQRMGIPGVTFLDREALKAHEPHLPKEVIGGMYMPTGGVTNPFEMAIALAENAITNGVRLKLDTQVIGMTVSNHHITSVKTNRGTLYPKIVINAAGVYADEIAEMADDRTFTIHPRRGTDIITDKKIGYMVHTSMGLSPFAVAPGEDHAATPIQRLKRFIQSATGKSHTKGVGLIHAVHGNMLIGPNAVETPDRENTETFRDEVEAIIAMQQKIAVGFKPSDVIAYFTGVRAATYEEDFVVRKGLYTDNILEAAGIQSPGVTAAPAIAEDLAKWAVEYLEKHMAVTPNTAFNPKRKVTPALSRLSDGARNALILQNPLYGEIICRCEEISKGEIIDALNAPLCVPTLDGIKRRLRPGMGRCQGGFCGPVITKIIAEHQGLKLTDVNKGNGASTLVFKETKGGSL